MSDGFLISLVLFPIWGDNRIKNNIVWYFSDLDGTSGILSSHLDFDQPGRGWNFRSPGHGKVDFENIIRELNIIGYQGPLSVEWEDCGMNREYGAADALKFLRKIDFPKSDIQFDAAF